MKPSELQEKTCHQFDCAIKTVIRHRAIDFYRAIRRSEKKEIEYYGAAEPPVRCGESHLSGLTEPLRSL